MRYTSSMQANTVEQTRLLLDAGADVNAKKNHGNTTLMLSQNEEQIKLLLESGADVNATNIYGYSVLGDLSNLRKKEIIEAFIRK